MNAETHYALSDIHIHHNSINKYYSKNIFSGLDVEATDLAKKWYKNNNFDNLISFDGISLIEIADYEFVHLFAYTIECIKSIEAVILKEKPQKIIFFDDWNGKIDGIAPKKWNNVFTNCVFSVGTTYNIDVEKIDLPSLSSGFKFQILDYFKKAILMNAFLFGCDMIASIQQYVYSNKTNILCSHDYAYLDRIFGESSNIRIFFFGASLNLVRNTISGIFSGKFLYWFPYYLYSQKSPGSCRYIGTISSEWKKVIDCRPNIRYGPYNLWDILEENFHYAFFDYFPSLISGYYRTKKNLVTRNIDLVIVSGIQVDYQRLLLLAAHAAGIPTVLIHHGVVFETIGFSSSLPLSEVEAWGQNEQDLLTDRKSVV